MNDSDVHSSSAGCLLRSAWFLVGPSLMVFMLFYIFHHDVSLPSGIDGAYLITLVITVGLRYVDVRYFGGQTAMGETATLSDWRRYTILLCLLFAAAWGVVRLALS